MRSQTTKKIDKVSNVPIEPDDIEKPGKIKLGRPLKYKTAISLQRGIEKYFQQQDAKEKPYTITGLALYLDMTRKMLIEYEDRETFRYVLNQARARIETQVEEYLLTGKNQAGAIFWLKNQGWSDKQEIEVNDITQLTKDDLVRKLKHLSGTPRLVKMDTPFRENVASGK